MKLNDIREQRGANNRNRLIYARFIELSDLAEARKLTTAEYAELRACDGRIQCFTAKQWLDMGEK